MKFFRPTENTKFHIDYAWFEENGQDVRVLIYKCLNPDQQDRVGAPGQSEMYDYVDDQTGEVQQVDQALHLIRTENAQDPNFITPRTPVFEAAFRIFLMNNNQPLTPVDMAGLMRRKPSEVLAQLSGRSIYNGIRPIFDAA
jgi:hypothetical protein